MSEHRQLSVDATDGAAAVQRIRRSLVDLLESVSESMGDGKFVAEECCDTALLITSELVTNAYDHAGTADEVTFILAERSLTIKVHDSSKQSPDIQSHDARGEAGGYGLALVDGLADQWGVVRDIADRGKTVYAMIRLSTGRESMNQDPKRE